MTASRDIQAMLRFRQLTASVSPRTDENPPVGTLWLLPSGAFVYALCVSDIWVTFALAFETGAPVHADAAGCECGWPYLCL